MHGYVKVGVLSVALLIPTLVVSALLGGVYGTIMVILWLLVTGLLGYLEFMNGSDPLTRLHRAPKGGAFSTQIQMLSTSYMSVFSWREHQKDYDSEGSVYKSYDLIASQMSNIIESAIKYIKSYDYYTKPHPEYLNNLVRQAKGLVEKLHELQDLILKVDDSTSDVDITYVDDLLEALREMKE